jgi:ethanolamine utilization protein
LNSIPKEELVEIITQEVMRIMDTKQEGLGSVPNKPGALVLGSAEKIPPEVLADLHIYGIDDYALHGDIDKYCCVYITEISLAQLSDIALGRDEKPYQCAVIKAILSGKKVYLLSEALTYHRFAKTANKTYYDMFVGYEKKIADSGVRIIQAVKLISPILAGQNEQNANCEALDCSDKVITGKKAEELSSKLQATVNLKRGTIITPLAKDAFGAAKIKINFV